jgi:acyl dehydratase
MSLDLSIVAPGTKVLTYTSEPISREALATYAEASGDLNPLHLDPAFARKAGFEDVIVHGMLSMAIVARMLLESFPAAVLTNLSARFVGTVPVNESLSCTASLDSFEFGVATLSLEAVTSRGAVALSASARLSCN